MQNLSTHILDTTCGQPATEVLVTLYRQESPEATTWTKIGSGSTDADGRFRQFFGSQQTGGLQRGVYKLHFEIDSYFRYRKVESFYPFIEIVFAVANETQHYHVPLLLNPFGYTTYRGS